MAQALQVDPVKKKAKHINSVHQRTVNLIEQKPNWTAREFKQKLEKVLLNITNAHTCYLTANEEHHLQKIAAQRFSEAVVWQSDNRKFDHVHKRYLTGIGVIAVAFSLNQEQRFSAIHLSGDFFSNINLQHFEQSLIGQVYQRQVVAPIIEHQLQKFPIKGLQPEQLTELLF
jgi:Bacterial lipoate protein ligase C-terminus.